MSDYVSDTRMPATVKLRASLACSLSADSIVDYFDDKVAHMEQEIECHPKYDGLTHINIYSRGCTRLGRLCSNHADIAIEHPFYGHFRNLEGLWYYLRTGKKHDSLRVLSAFDARTHGKDLEKEWNPQFNQEFKMGIVAKVQASEELRQLLSESTLPFVHYYVYGKGDDPKIIVPKGHDWQMLMWDKMRIVVKEGRALDDVMKWLKRHPKRYQP